MNISVCITTFNEEGSIFKLIQSLLVQSIKPDEIVIVDNYSSDKTVEIVRHFQKKDKRIKLLIENCTRGKGRNLSVDIAKCEIIAMTDAGCIPQKSWLKNLTNGIKEVNAGFYDMVYKNSFQEGCAVFLGTKSEDFDESYLPSTRSIAFTKNVWEKVGGFNERLNYAEDTDFNSRLLKNGINISRVKDARVEWGMPSTLKEFFNKISNYAMGDVMTNIWKLDDKHFMSHNIHSLFVLFRSLLLIILITLLFLNNIPLAHLTGFLIVGFYFLYSFKKASFWGLVLQPLTDAAVINGFLKGVFKKT